MISFDKRVETQSVVTFSQLLGIGKSPRSAYLYARQIDRAVLLLADRGTDLENCTGEDIAAIAAQFGKSHSQRQQLRAALVAAWDVLERDNSPVRALRVPPRPKLRSKALTEPGAQTLEMKAWERQDENCGLAVLIGLYSGLRRAEIAELRWEHVHVDEHGWPEWLRIVGKGDVQADVPVHPVLAEVLERWRRAQGWVFPGRYRGRPVSASTVWTWIREIAADAGLAHVTPHVLRHTALSEMNDRSGDLRATQEIARHSRPETTAGYTRVGGERLKKVVSMVYYGREAGPGAGDAA